jgi:hypothetical protein
VFRVRFRTTHGQNSKVGVMSGLATIRPFKRAARSTYGGYDPGAGNRGVRMVHDWAFAPEWFPLVAGRKASGSPFGGERDALCDGRLPPVTPFSAGARAKALTAKERKAIATKGLLKRRRNPDDAKRETAASPSWCRREEAAF